MDYRKYAQPHPHWTEFPKNLPAGTKQYGMTREHDLIKPQDGLAVDEFHVKARDSHPICVRSYRQSALNKALPVLVYCHGGGFITGGLETDDELCRAIAADVAIIVLNVEYRLAPEDLFPVPIQDCHDVVRWVASAGGQLSLNASPADGFLLGGTSAGGNFTCGIAHLAVEEKMAPPLTGLLFMASNVCHPDEVPEKWRDRLLSANEINDSPSLTARSIRYFADKYGAPHDAKLYSPLLYESHADLASKAVFQICGWDPRRDEMILYDQVLRDSGTDTKVHIYSGLPHGFWQTCPSLPESKAALQDSIDGVRWLLS